MVFALQNFGNTCYINTAFQCILSSRPIIRAIIDSPSNAAIVTTLQQFVRTVQAKQNHHDDFKMVLRILHAELSEKIPLFSQNDLTEFICLFFQLLHEKTIVPETHSYPFAKKELRDDNIYNLCAKKWNDYFDKEFSCIRYLTTSMIVHRITCSQCDTTHPNFEFNNALQIDAYANSLHDCIHEFMQPHVVNDSNDDDKTIKWKCDHCKRAQLSQRTASIRYLPEVLFVFFNRFTYNVRRATFVKNTNAIQVHRTLDMSSFTDNADDQTCVYKLSAMGCHIGTIDFGHYFTILADDDTNDFVKIDDDNIQQIDDYDRYLPFVYCCVYTKKICPQSNV
jgi:ubiquitin C-terminal hydrolase